MKGRDIYSPLDIVRLLGNTCSRRPCVVQQMTVKHFFDFRDFSKLPCFDFAIPFMQVKHIVLMQNDMVLKYRLSFESEIMLEHKILNLKVTRKTQGPLKRNFNFNGLR